MPSLSGKTLFITGASRGIGLSIALRAARDGANIAVAAKTASPDPRLPGTVHSAVEQINAAGGHGLACPCDVRLDDQISVAVQRTVETFGGIDILVNNASALFLAGTLDTPTKRFDLIHAVNVRGTFLASQACLPHLKRAANPHILNLAPPLNIEARWFAPHLAYSLSKFGMSLCVLGMAEEFRSAGIAVNSLDRACAFSFVQTVRLQLHKEVRQQFRSRIDGIARQVTHAGVEQHILVEKILASAFAARPREDLVSRVGNDLWLATTA